MYQRQVHTDRNGYPVALPLVTESDSQHNGLLT